MQYEVYIQEIYAGLITATNTSEALKIIGTKIATKEYLYDESKPKSIRIEPKDE